MILNQEERRGVLRSLRHFCTLAFLPLEVCVDSWEVHQYGSWRKRLLGQISFAVYILHIAFQVFSLLCVFLFLRDTPGHQVIIHMILASMYAGATLWYHLLYVKYRGINAAVIRMTLTESIIEGNFSPPARSLQIILDNSLSLWCASKVDNFYSPNGNIERD